MYEDPPVSGEDKKDAPAPESAHDAHDTQRNLDVGALVEGFGRRRPPQKVEQPVSAGEDAAGYYASPKPPPTASDQRVQTGRIEIRATDPGIGKPVPERTDELGTPEEIEAKIRAAQSGPPEDIEPHEYAAVRELHENMPRPVLEGFETDPSKRRKESQRKRILVALAGVGTIGVIVALAIAKATPKNLPITDGAQPTRTVSTTPSPPATSNNPIPTVTPTPTPRPTETSTQAPRPTTTMTAPTPTAPSRPTPSAAATATTVPTTASTVDDPNVSGSMRPK